MRNAKPRPREVRGLAREHYEVGVRKANEKILAAPRTYKRRELEPHVVAEHEAVAGYVFKNFKRPCARP